MTFFLQFFPDLVKHEKVYVLETPLFRVRNMPGRQAGKQETIYCYDENEKQEAMKKLGAKAEVTRFKGLGEISPDEFAQFIGTDMRKILMRLEQGDHIQQLLEYYMGKNTPDRQDFIINNLKVESDEPVEAN
jgi:topoisomerase-4 subunit B